jgi:hypothetical protein
MASVPLIPVTVLLLVFWAFQKGYVDSLGTAAWFAGAVIFGKFHGMICPTTRAARGSDTR